jgi:hypothetical protein
MKSLDKLNMFSLIKLELSPATLWNLKSFQLELILMEQILNLKNLKKKMFAFMTLDLLSILKINNQKIIKI